MGWRIVTCGTPISCARRQRIMAKVNRVLRETSFANFKLDFEHWNRHSLNLLQTPTSFVKKRMPVLSNGRRFIVINSSDVHEQTQAILTQQYTCMLTTACTARFNALEKAKQGCEYSIFTASCRHNNVAVETVCEELISYSSSGVNEAVRNEERSLEWEARSVVTTH